MLVGAHRQVTPHRVEQFVRLQQSLTGDALNEYIRHVWSAVFVCPPGLRPGQDWGGALFG